MGDNEAGENHVHEEMIADRGIEPDLAAPGDRHPPADNQCQSDKRPENMDRDPPKKMNLGLGKIWDHLNDWFLTQMCAQFEASVVFPYRGKG